VDRLNSCTAVTGNPGTVAQDEISAIRLGIRPTPAACYAKNFLCSVSSSSLLLRVVRRTASRVWFALIIRRRLQLTLITLNWRRWLIVLILFRQIRSTA